MTKNKGLYIHIPFCDEICPYCAFSHYLADESKKDKYIDRLKEDIYLLKDKFFSSIYIGGGTPSSLNVNQLERLLECLKKFNHNNLSFTFEANPSSLTEEKIALLKKYHVNRVSIGVQTFNKELQKRLKRFTTYNKIKE